MRWSGWQRELTTGSDERLGPSGASNDNCTDMGKKRYIHLYFKVELGSLCLGNKNVNSYRDSFRTDAIFFVSDYVNHLRFSFIICFRCWSYMFSSNTGGRFPSVVVPNHIEQYWTFNSSCINFNCVDVFFMKWRLIRNLTTRQSLPAEFRPFFLLEMVEFFKRKNSDVFLREDA